MHVNQFILIKNNSAIDATCSFGLGFDQVTACHTINTNTLNLNMYMYAWCF